MALPENEIRLTPLEKEPTRPMTEVWDGLKDMTGASIAQRIEPALWRDYITRVIFMGEPGVGKTTAMHQLGIKLKHQLKALEGAPLKEEGERRIKGIRLVFFDKVLEATEQQIGPRGHWEGDRQKGLIIKDVLRRMANSENIGMIDEEVKEAMAEMFAQRQLGLPGKIRFERSMSDLPPEYKKTIAEKWYYLLYLAIEFGLESRFYTAFNSVQTGPIHWHASMFLS